MPSGWSGVVVFFIRYELSLAGLRSSRTPPNLNLTAPTPMYLPMHLGHDAQYDAEIEI